MSSSLVSSLCQKFTRKTMLSYFLSLGNESTNHSLTSSISVGKKTIGVSEGNMKCVFRDIGFFVGDGSARKLIVVIVAKLYEYMKRH